MSVEAAWPRPSAHLISALYRKLTPCKSCRVKTQQIHHETSRARRAVSRQSGRTHAIPLYRPRHDAETVHEMRGTGIASLQL